MKRYLNCYEGMDMRYRKSFLGLQFAICIFVILSCLCGCRSKDRLTDNNSDRLTDNNIDVSGYAEVEKRDDTNQDTHPDGYYINWVVPELGLNISDENIAKVNKKLEEDGYGFGVRLVKVNEPLDSDEYEEGIYAYGDIAFTGWGLNGTDPAEKMLADGKLFDFTELAEKSPYFQNMNPLLKESVTINGRLYYFPNEIAQDGSMQNIACNMPDSQIIPFSGDNILELDNYVTDSNLIYYGWSGFDFTRCFGYDYDTVRGIVVTENGNIFNPLEDEKCLEWMNMVNKWYRKGCVRTTNKDTIKATCGILLTINDRNRKDDYTEICSWQRKMCKKITATTVILADSQKKEKAFKFLELIRTNHDYGNLIIYGHTESTDISKEPGSFNNKLILGLDDGLLSGEKGMNHFMTQEERSDFYDNNVEASVTLYMDLPFECSELKKIVENYLGYNNSILFSEDYEEKLEVFKKEYNEKLSEIRMTLDKNETGMQ